MNEEANQDLSLLDDPKAEDKEVKKTSDNKIDDDLFNQLLSQNIGEGTFEEIKPDVEEKEADVKYKVSSEIEPLGKYSDEIVKDIMSNPGKYKMKSPKHGEMNLKEALDKGYNPESDEFDRKKKRSKEEITEGLSDSDKESIDKITDPKSAKIPAKEAEALGVKDPNFIAQEDAPTDMVMPEAQPVAEGQEGEEGMAGLEALLGGGM